MVAAVSIQTAFSNRVIVHTAYLMENDTQQDILEDARLLGMNNARTWSEEFDLGIVGVTISAQWEDGTWYHDPYMEIWKD